MTMSLQSAFVLAENLEVILYVEVLIYFYLTFFKKNSPLIATERN